MEAYNYERLSPQSYFRIQELYSSCFHFDTELDYIVKKYNTHKFGAANIGVLALSEENESAAYYGVFPISAIVNGKKQLIAQSGDTMTDPNHQKRGLFVKLAQKAYELAKEEGVQLVYGFPNENSYPGFANKLNWQFNGVMQRFVVPTSKFPLCEFVAKYRFFNGIYKRFVNRKLRKHQNTDFNFKMNPEKEKSYIVRDEAFFEYKLNNSDNHLVSINGFKLLIKVEGHLVIGDVEYFDKSRTEEFLKTIRQLGKTLFCRKAMLTLSKNYWLYSYISKNLEHSDHLPIGFYQISEEIDINAFAFTHADYDTF